MPNGKIWPNLAFLQILNRFLQNQALYRRKGDFYMNRMKKKKSAVIIFRNIFLALFIVVAVSGGAITLRGYFMYTSALERLPTAKAAREVREQEGFTPIGDLPEAYLDAVVAAEDHRFYEHGGVDFIAIGRALVNDVLSLSFKEGGSTVTQQLAKNLYFTQEKELTRKVAEMFMAWTLESDFTKDEILELYVNSIYFGSGCYTVGDASRAYFDKEPAQMTDREATLLAGIPNAPSVYDLNENPELAYQRQRHVVALMVKYTGLSQERADAILEGTDTSPEEGGVVLCAEN